MRDRLKGCDSKRLCFGPYHGERLRMTEITKARLDYRA